MCSHVFIHTGRDRIHLFFIYTVFGVRFSVPHVYVLGKKKDIETSALLALKVVEITLERQREFTHCLRQQNSSMLVTPLDQLLLGVGVRSQGSDSIAKIAR